jgi:Ca2+-binding RTX toxin-like protein
MRPQPGFGSVPRRRLAHSRRSARHIAVVEPLEPRLVLSSGFGVGYANTYGSPNSALGLAVAVDQAGDTYVTGNYQGTVNFGSGPGVTTLTSVPGAFADGYLAKYDPNGNLDWVKDMGAGDWNDYAGLTVDKSSGDVIATGFFEGTVNFGGSSGTMTAVAPNAAYIVKYDGSGNLIWARKFDAQTNSSLNGVLGQTVATDASGNVYIAGEYQGTINFAPGTGSAWETNNSGNSNAYIAKLDAAGNFGWVDVFNGPSGNWILGLGLDGSGNIYANGEFWATVDFDPGPGTANRTSPNSTSSFVLKLNNAGGFDWVNTYSSLSGTAGVGYGLGVDAAGDTYSIGYFNTTVNFDPSGGTATRTSAGSFDGYLLKLDPSGNYTWVDTYGSTGADESQAVAFDGAGAVYLAASYSGTVSFGPGPGAATFTSQGYSSLALLKYDTSGNVVAAGQMTGSGTANAFGLAALSDGRTWVTGDYFSGSVEVEGGAGTATLPAPPNSSANAYLVELTPPPTDLKAIFATTDGQSQLQLIYEVDGNVNAPVQVGIYRSADGLFDSGALLLTTLTITDPSQLTPGQHTLTYTIGGGAGQVPLPGDGAAEVNADYSVLMVMDPNNQVPDTDNDAAFEDNVVPLIGAYTSTGTLYVHGSTGDDTIVLSPSGGNVVLSGVPGTNLTYNGLTQIRVRSHFGYDSVSGAGVPVPMWIWGGDGNDTLQGGTAADSLYGGSGSNTYVFAVANPSANNTVTVGLSGATLVETNGPHVDKVTFNPTDQLVIQGGAGNDRISVAPKVTLPALIEGGAGNDSLTAGGGNDTLIAGGGNDWLVAGTGNDSINGGSGNSSLTITAVPGNVQVVYAVNNGALTIATNGSAQAATMTNIDRLTLNGGSGNDLIDLSGLSANPMGGAANLEVRLVSGSGDDTLMAGAGNETLIGGAGNDVLDAGPGNDWLQSGVGNNTLNGGAGNDILVFLGTAGNDYLSLVPITGTQLKAQRSDAATPNTVLQTDIFNVQSSNRISILAGAGDDQIYVDPSITIKGTVDGGPGYNTCVAPADWIKKNCQG